MIRFLVIVTALCSSTAAHATDAEAKAKLALANKAFAQRDSHQQNELAITKFNEALVAASDSALKYEALIKMSYAMHWRVIHTNTGDKAANAAIYEKGIQYANSAIVLNGQNADAYYYYAFALMHWMNNVPQWQAGLRLTELKRYFLSSSSNTQMNKAPGEAIDEYGSHRYLGMIDYATGDRAEALKKLSLAFQNNPDRPENVTFYAEVLFNKGEVASNPYKGCAILRELLARPGNSFNPDRLPEVRRELMDAKKLFDANLAAGTCAPATN